MVLPAEIIAALAEPQLAAEACTGPPDEPLWPEEHAVVQAWVAARRGEFALGRCCARRALARLGVAAAPIVSDTDGAPTWPTGIVGSLSHKRGCCLAVVGRARDFVSVGVDLECDDQRGEDGLASTVCTEAERARLHDLVTICRSPATLVLAAKEAFYKYQYPLTQRRLTYADAGVAFGHGTFDVWLADDPARSVAARGRFTATGGWIATLVMARNPSP